MCYPCVRCGQCGNVIQLQFEPGKDFSIAEPEEWVLREDSDNKADGSKEAKDADGTFAEHLPNGS